MNRIELGARVRVKTMFGGTGTVVNVSEDRLAVRMDASGGVVRVKVASVELIESKEECHDPDKPDGVGGPGGVAPG